MIATRVQAGSWNASALVARPSPVTFGAVAVSLDGFVSVAQDPATAKILAHTSSGAEATT